MPTGSTFMQSTSQKPTSDFDPIISDVGGTSVAAVREAMP